VRGGALPGSGALPGGWARITPEGATPAWNVTVMWVETGFRSRGGAGGTRAALDALGNSCVAAAASAPPPEVECVTLRVWP